MFLRLGGSNPFEMWEVITFLKRGGYNLFETWEGKSGDKE